MTDNVIYVRDVLDPLPVFDTVDRIVRCGGGDTFNVRTSISRATRTGYQIVTHQGSGQMVIARPCAAGDDPRIVEAAIEGWRSGFRRGRQQMCEEIQLPELQ